MLAITYRDRQDLYSDFTSTLKYSLIGKGKGKKHTAHFPFPFNLKIAIEIAEGEGTKSARSQFADSAMRERLKHFLAGTGPQDGKHNYLYTVHPNR